MLAPLALTLGCAAAVDIAIPGDDPRVQLTGAAELDDEPGALLRFSAAGVRVRFRGTARFVFGDDHDAEEDGGNRFAVDDEDAVPVAGFVEIVAPAPRTVTLQKTSEALFGARRLLAVIVHGELLAPAPQRRTLVVLGDSWATGFGVRGDLVDPTTGTVPGPHCPFTPDTSDVRLAWPALVARKLDLDVAVVAWAGRGVWRDWQGEVGPASVPALLRASTFALNDVALVAIALGHNDGNEGVPDAAPFAAAWRGLVDDVRDRWPAARVLALAPRFSDDPPALDRSAALRPLLADPRVVVVDEPPMPTSPPGCVWHPGTRAQRSFADAVAALLDGALDADGPRGR